jgi:ferric-dicitrate binding protein FerR (iron transport regulator)
MLETAPAGRAAVQLESGTALRLDRGTTLRVQSVQSVELVHGAVYVDNAGGSGRSIEIRTPHGTVRDIGTQFEARLIGSRLRVRVRSGLVEVSDGHGTMSGDAGTEITAGTGALLRARASVYGPDWDWIAEVAPAVDIEIEGRPLAAFLTHVSREHGWTLRYASPIVERTAAETILHGSVEGLTGEQALATVVPASGLRYALQDGVLTLSSGEIGR